MNCSRHRCVLHCNGTPLIWQYKACCSTYIPVYMCCVKPQSCGTAKPTFRSQGCYMYFSLAQVCVAPPRITICMSIQALMADVVLNSQCICCVKPQRCGPPARPSFSPLQCTLVVNPWKLQSYDTAVCKGPKEQSILVLFINNLWILGTPFIWQYSGKNLHRSLHWIYLVYSKCSLYVWGRSYIFPGCFRFDNLNVKTRKQNFKFPSFFVWPLKLFPNWFKCEEANGGLCFSLMYIPNHAVSNSTWHLSWPRW